MPSDLSIQFYVFDEDFYAIPFSELSAQDRTHLWQPAVRLITHLTKAYPVITHHTDGWENIPRIIILLTEMRFLCQPEVYRNLTRKHAGHWPLRPIKTQNPGEVERIYRQNHLIVPDVNQQIETLRKPYLSPAELERALRRASPIIVVATEDLMDLFAESSPNERQARAYQYGIPLDTRLKFWDCGIWHRYVPLQGRHDAGDEQAFSKRFERVFRQMTQWHSDGLYASYVALENIEFQTRMMLNSSIATVGHHAHEQRVTPFKFHSETHMERMSQQILDTFRNNERLWEKVRWRLLLIDDQGEKALSGYRNEDGISKKALIERTLNQGFDMPVFEVAPTSGIKGGHIDDALAMLKTETYDVILLDYLLGEGSNERDGREYGYDFLLKIADHFDRSPGDEAHLLHKGPLGRFWIFSVSSFPFAFSDKLRQLGMDGYSDHWYLSNGGDPVCSPALFRYNFLKMIKQQITECYLYPEALRGFFGRFANIQTGNLWQSLVLNAFQQVEVQSKYLENDDQQGSQFAREMRTFLGENAQEYDKLLTIIKDFVGRFNAKVIHFTNFDEDLAAVSDVVLRRSLIEKAFLFFKPEKKFIDRVYAHPLQDPNFRFDNERLRWLPYQIGELGLKKIKQLDLSNNELTLLPEELSEIKTLLKLDLSHNNLIKLNESITSLSALELLDLTGNNLLGPNLAKKHTGKLQIQHALNTYFEGKT